MTYKLTSSDADVALFELKIVGMETISSDNNFGSYASSLGYSSMNAFGAGRGETSTKQHILLFEMEVSLKNRKLPLKFSVKQSMNIAEARIGDAFRKINNQNYNFQPNGEETAHQTDRHEFLYHHEGHFYEVSAGCSRLAAS